MLKCFEPKLPLKTGETCGSCGLECLSDPFLLIVVPSMAERRSALRMRGTDGERWSSVTQVAGRFGYITRSDLCCQDETEPT